jgi:DNA-binding transcriptional MocR family regulator
MTIWHPDPASLQHPLHSGLASAIAHAISEGKLQIGQQLPTHRKMAESLGLSVHTVSKAYDALRRQNLIDGQVGRGSYVVDPNRSNDQPFKLKSERRDGFDLSISRPVFSNIHVDRFQKALAEIHNNLDPSVYLSCRPNIGHEAHRVAGVKWLAACGIETTPEQIIMTNGVTHGMSAALSALTRPGDTVLSDSITHHLVVSGCSCLGLNLVGIQVDEFGMCPESLERYCQKIDAKVLFLLPSLTNPTAVIMPEERRLALVDVARKHNLYIIENDAFGPVIEHRPIPVASLAPERTIYLTSFTKCTVSGLRAGYLVAPDHLLPALTGRLIVFGWMATPLVCELASRWVLDGTALELAMWQRVELCRRFQIVEQALQGMQWSGRRSGLHIWLTLPEGWTTSSFVAYARELKIAVAPDTPFLTPKTPSQNAVRISLGSIQDIEHFKRAMSLLAGMLTRPNEVLPQFAY